jgi:hypothetical protein
VKIEMRTLVVLSVALLLAFTARAEDKWSRFKVSRYAGLFTFPRKIVLSDAQKEQVAAWIEEYTQKMETLDEREARIVSPERRRDAEDAVRSAKAEGRRVRELNGIRQAALNLTMAEKDALQKLYVLRMKLVQEIQAKRMSLLTKEQKAVLGPSKGDKGDG